MITTNEMLVAWRRWNEDPEFAALLEAAARGFQRHVTDAALGLPSADEMTAQDERLAALAERARLLDPALTSQLGDSLDSVITMSAATEALARDPRLNEQERQSVLAEWGVTPGPPV